MKGIYKITCLANNKVYIGQSVMLNKRLKSHFSHLRRGVHHNEHLQKSFNKYGEDNFLIEILAECSKSELDNLEKQFIAAYKSTNHKYGFNMMDGGQGDERHFTPYVKLKMGDKLKGRKFSEEHKRKLSEINKGKVISKESIEKCKATIARNQSRSGEKNGNAIISNDEAYKIIEFLLVNYNPKLATKEFNVSYGTVMNLIYNRSYLNVLPNEREKLKLMSAKNFSDKLDICVGMYLSGMSQNEIAKTMYVSRNSLRAELIKRNIDTQINTNQFVQANTEICKHITQGCLRS